MIPKKSRLPVFEQHQDLLAQLQAEAAVGWSNVSPPLTDRQLIVKQIVETIHHTIQENEHARPKA